MVRQYLVGTQTHSCRNPSQADIFSYHFLPKNAVKLAFLNVFCGCHTPNSPKSVRWSAVPVPPMWVYVSVWWWEGQWPQRGWWPMLPKFWSSRLEFEHQQWDLSHEAVIWAMRLWFEPWGDDLSLKAGIWAKMLWFEPQLEAVIWASRLWFGPWGCDLSQDAGILGLRLGF